MAKVMVAQTYGQLECCTRLTPTCFQTIGFWIFKLFQKSSGSAVRPLLLPPTFKTRAVMVFPKPSSHHPGQGPGWHSVQWNHQRCSTMCKVTFEPSTSVCCCRGWLYCKRVWPMSMWSHPWQSHPPNHPLPVISELLLLPGQICFPSANLNWRCGLSMWVHPWHHTSSSNSVSKNCSHIIAALSPSYLEFSIF